METHEILKAAGCQMEVICKKPWSELDETDEDGIRFCRGCKQAIFYTTTPAELRVAAEKRFCVYIVPGSAASQNNRYEITRERIRQIDAETLTRLKGPTLGVPKLR